AAPDAGVAPDPAVVAVNDWLEALRTQDLGKLRDTTHLPLSYKSTGKKRLCEGGAKDAAALERLMKCFAKKEDLFLGELQWAADANFDPKVVDAKHASKELLKLLSKTERAQKLVEGFINGDGVTYGLLFAIAPGEAGKPGVSALALSAFFPE